MMNRSKEKNLKLLGYFVPLAASNFTQTLIIMTITLKCMLNYYKSPSPNTIKYFVAILNILLPGYQE